MILSICGVCCISDCKAYQVECEGCKELRGKVSWAEFYGTECCPIYACATAKGLQSCGECSLAPCSVWFDTRNPDATDEEFAADLASRLHHLQKDTSPLS